MLIMPCPYYGLVIRPWFDTPKVLSFMSLNQFAKRVKIMLIMPCPYYYGLVIRPLFGTTKVLSLNPIGKRVKIMPCSLQHWVCL
jgi:hypothetical protein